MVGHMTPGQQITTDPAEAPPDPPDAAEAPKTPPTARQTPNEPPSPPNPATEATQPARRGGTPPTPAANDRGLNRGGIVGANAILASGRAPTPTPTPTNSKRRARTLTIPHDTFARIEKSHMNRADLLLTAASRHGHQLQNTLRRQTPGRVRFCVSLNDEEHSRLQRIAQRRGWPLSPTAVVLIELYLDELDQKRLKKPKRPRAQR